MSHFEKFLDYDFSLFWLEAYKEPELKKLNIYEKQLLSTFFSSNSMFPEIQVELYKYLHNKYVYTNVYELDEKLSKFDYRIDFFAISFIRYPDIIENEDGKFIGFNPFKVGENVIKMNENNEKVDEKYKTYLVYDSNTGYVKIGKSINPQIRVKTIKISNINAELIAECNENVETELHKRFVSKRVKGEWYKLTKKDIEMIKKDYGFK